MTKTVTLKHALYLLISAQVVLGAQPYLGCVISYPEGDFEIDVPEGSTCLQECTAEGQLYAYTDAGTGGAPCACGGIPSLPLDYLNSASTDSSCNAGGYLMQRTSSRFNHLDCTGPNGEIFFDQTETLQFRSIQECFDNCQSYTFAVARPDGDSQEFNCFCGNDQGEFQYTEQVCDAGSEYIFQNVGESPSEIVGRRRLKERRELAKARKLGKVAGPICPKGLEACNVPGVEGAFECIDTNSELESCGGCAHGRFGEKIASRSTGVDCTSLPGVRLGASTCYEGKCEVYACKQGWYWSKGACVKK